MNIFLAFLLLVGYLVVPRLTLAILITVLFSATHPIFCFFVWMIIIATWVIKIIIAAIDE